MSSELMGFRSFLTQRKSQDAGTTEMRERYHRERYHRERYHRDEREALRSPSNENPPIKSRKA
jgi:hypothetical protein